MKSKKRSLSKKRYPWQKMLIQASKGMVHITDGQKLLNLIVHIVKKYIRVRNVSIFQYNEKEDAFILEYRRGENKKPVGYRIENSHPLIICLKNKRDVLLSGDADDPRGLKGELKNIDCAVCVPSFWKDELLGFLILGKKLSGDIYTKEETGLLLTLSNGVAVAIENAKNFTQLEKHKERERENYFQTVLALAKTVDEKDPYTRGHLDEVTRYGMEVAGELSSLIEIELNMEELKISLMLHDIGKIGVPDALLHKNGDLTPEEWVIMKQHPEIGARIIRPVKKLKNVGRIVRHHQEKYDGSGYPDGLKGEEIPLESRIISVVDAYHAMVSDRPYRKAMSSEVAIEELKKNIGAQFDPDVVKAFIKAWEKGKIRKA